MSLEKKLQLINSWSHVEALNLWTRYHDLYLKKHNGALYKAINHGNLNEYINKECETFRRYVLMYQYKKKHP